jgi:hypothetical protein
MLDLDELFPPRFDTLLRIADEAQGPGNGAPSYSSLEDDSGSVGIGSGCRNGNLKDEDDAECQEPVMVPSGKFSSWILAPPSAPIILISRNFTKYRCIFCATNHHKWRVPNLGVL